MCDSTVQQKVSSSAILCAVDELKSPADNPDWFRDAKLNWAENMLLKKWRDDEGRVAMIQVGEYPKYLSVAFTQDEFFAERVLASISDQLFVKPSGTASQ